MGSERCTEAWQSLVQRFFVTFLAHGKSSVDRFFFSVSGGGIGLVSLHSTAWFLNDFFFLKAIEGFQNDCKHTSSAPESLHLWGSCSVFYNIKPFCDLSRVVT